MDKRASIIEGIGLLLLLLSFGWQCIEEDAQSDNLLHRISQLEAEMINYSTSELYATYVCSDYFKNDSIGKKIETQDIAKDIENSKYKIRTFKNDIKSLEDEVSVFVWIRRILYVIGSILIIIPKLCPTSDMFRKEKISK